MSHRGLSGTKKRRTKKSAAGAVSEANIQRQLSPTPTRARSTK
jgi:hypothetical protein